MVYKGAKYLQFLSIGSYIGESYNPTEMRARGVSPTAYFANRAGYSATMQAKSGVLNGKSAASVAQTTAALTNQAGGNIGFTYE